MTLHAQLELTRGSLDLAIDLLAHERETVALVGPNGAGKTSFLEAIAGLLRIDRGRIALGERILDGGRSGPFVAPEDRRVGFVFQDHLLFPHLTALENVAFGLRSRGIARPTARGIARAWLERVGSSDCADARPRALSGGQAQRVALARALASSPRILLLDEPLSAVDASARLQLRRELRLHLEDFAGVRLLVAHDAIDAFALADRVVVLESGRIVQSGTVAEICSRPRSRYVADLVGVNCMRGTAHDGIIQLPSGAQLVAPSPIEGPAFATVHPRAVALFRARPAGSPRNVWSAPILGIEPAFDRARVQIGGPLPLVAEVTPQAVRDLSLVPGGEVWVALKATEIVVFPA